MKEEKPRLLTEHDMDEIAQKAAKRAIESVYAGIGKSVVKKVCWAAGFGTLALLAYLANEGRI